MSKNDRSENGGTIHIALAFCDPRGTYSRHAAATMASIFANTERPVCVHILHDGTLTAENRDKLELLAQNFGQRIAFEDVERRIAECGIDTSRLTADGARGTLFRLLIPDVAAVDRIIYLDCDIIVNRDIAELWELPLRGRAVGAVRDVWSLNFMKGTPIPWRMALVWDTLGIAHDSYFNAGVLLLNLKKLREEYDFLRAVEGFYAAYRKCITLADQDCLNYIFAGDALLIDERFNRIRTDGVREEELRGSIWHMASSAKPWTTGTRPLVDDLYWRYLRMTPYCESEDALIRLMLHDLSASPYTHLHSSGCVRRLSAQMADNLLRAHIWTAPHLLVKRFWGRRPPRNGRTE